MPAAELPTRRQFVLNLLWFGFNFQTAALLPVVVPAQVLLIVAPGSVASAEQAAYLGRLAALAAVVALILQPLVGLVSDRTRSALGRRRPHIIWGTAVMLLGAVALTRAGGPWSFAAAFLVFQVGNTAAVAAYQGLLPDIVPRRQRGSASGLLGLMTILGNAASLGLAAVILSEAAASRPAVITSGATAYYLVTIVVLALACAVTVAGIAERSSRDSRASLRWGWARSSRYGWSPGGAGTTCGCSSLAFWSSWA